MCSSTVSPCRCVWPFQIGLGLVRALGIVVGDRDCIVAAEPAMKVDVGAPF